MLRALLRIYSSRTAAAAAASLPGNTSLNTRPAVASTDSALRRQSTQLVPAHFRTSTLPIGRRRRAHRATRCKADVGTEVAPFVCDGRNISECLSIVDVR